MRRAPADTAADQPEHGPRASGPPGASRPPDTPTRELTPTQRDRLASLLEETSRTFALSIPLLDEPLRSEVTIAYLLFRIADTIEDEVDWAPADKVNALRVFTGLLGEQDHGAVTPGLIDMIVTARVAHAGYARLMADTSFVLECFASLAPGPRAAIAGHLTRTADGMARQVESDAAPADLAGAQDYCYAVAGIVGELCTELFVHRNGRLAPARETLITLAPRFGEGLQLVNILRDETDDARAGRRYIPGFKADTRAELMQIAARDLRAASEYVRTLESNGATPETVAFNALNVALAFETLAIVMHAGPGAKLTRSRVAELYASIRDAVDANTPISPLLDRSAACLPHA